MDRRFLLLLPVVGFLLLGAIGYVSGMPKAAPMVGGYTKSMENAASVTSVTGSESLGARTGGAQGPGGAVGTASTAPSVDQEWLLRTGAATGIPVRALAAYATAAHLIEVAQPSCHLAWNTLAAIGYVESAHGTHGGATLGDDGVSAPSIIGLPLNGDGVAAIADTDRGGYDGDRVWDRAVGPLQFIPSTWASHGVDADGDGVANPQDIDDASLTAAAYLCVSGDLASAEGWTAAVFSYNHLDSYVAAVRERATLYAEQSGS